MADGGSGARGNGCYGTESEGQEEGKHAVLTAVAGKARGRVEAAGDGEDGQRPEEEAELEAVSRRLPGPRGSA